MNIYVKIWLISWILSIPFTVVFDWLNEDYDFVLWDFLYKFNILVACSIPLFVLIGLPIMAIINM